MLFVSSGVGLEEMRECVRSVDRTVYRTSWLLTASNEGVLSSLSTHIAPPHASSLMLDHQVNKCNSKNWHHACRQVLPSRHEDAVAGLSPHRTKSTKTLLIINCLHGRPLCHGPLKPLSVTSGAHDIPVTPPACTLNLIWNGKRVGPDWRA